MCGWEGGGQVTTGLQQTVPPASTRALQNFGGMTSQTWPDCRNKKGLGSRSNPPEKFCLRLWCLLGGDARLGSAVPAVVVVPHMAVGGNPLLLSSQTAGFAANNRPYHKQHPPCFGCSLCAMDGGWDGIVHGNAQVFNNVCDLYGIARARQNYSAGARPITIALHLVGLIGRSQFTDQFQTL